MKTTLWTLVFVLMTTFSFAQSSEHLSFKGVPIDGTLSEYVSKMKSNGFSLLENKKGVAILMGDFAGYKDCMVMVSTLDQNDLVYNINVQFPKRDTWSTLSGNYFDLKKMLTEKYGVPSVVVEKFNSTNYQTKDDVSKMHDVGMDRCKYYSIWQTEKGKIQLSIDHDGLIKKFVSLGYFDKINSEKIKAKAIDDL